MERLTEGHMFEDRYILKKPVLKRNLIQYIGRIEYKLESKDYEETHVYISLQEGTVTTKGNFGIKISDGHAYKGTKQANGEWIWKKAYTGE